MNFSPKHISISAFLLLSSSLLLLPSIGFAEDNTWTSVLPTQQRSKLLLKIAELKKLRAMKAQNANISDISQDSLKYNIPNVDKDKVEKTWLDRINTERKTKNLEPLSIDNSLVKTSILRAEDLGSKNKFTNMHQRPGCNSRRCTDIINKWFQDNGVSTIANESVLRGSYSCIKGDCTDIFITKTQWRDGWPSGFLWFLMGEKKWNGVHYKMMTSSTYTKVGFGFALWQHPTRWQQYILVIHFSN